MKSMKHLMCLCVSVVCALLAACSSDDTSVQDDSSKFVMLTEAVPDAILEIRYYGTYNFVGARIDGYEQPTALLTKEAAAALKAVSDDVVKQGYRLKMLIALKWLLTILCGGRLIFRIQR